MPGDRPSSASIDELHTIVGAGAAEGAIERRQHPQARPGPGRDPGHRRHHCRTEYRKHIEKDAAPGAPLPAGHRPRALHRGRRQDAPGRPSPTRPARLRCRRTGSPHRGRGRLRRRSVISDALHLPIGSLPDKAIDLLDEACSDVNLHNETLARLAAVRKERADLAKEKELLLSDVSKQDEQRNDDLTANEQKQARSRQELSALSQARRAIMADQTLTEETRRSRLETNDARRADIQRTLDALAEERQAIQGREADKSFERLAIIRSQDMRLEQEQQELEAKPWPELNVENLARVIEQWTGIPASRIQEAEFGQLAHLGERLRARIIGQDQAIDAVTAAIRRNRVGISPKHKPVSFIFVGSTGVGKTELVKQLAQELFQTPRLPDPAGHVRVHGEALGLPDHRFALRAMWAMTRRASSRRRSAASPTAVILFDEIEKAHPDVLNVLLQILDDGQITDAHGRTVNFENTVIVMTSNAGSDQQGAGPWASAGLPERAGRGAHHEGPAGLPAPRVHQPGG